MYAQLDKAIAEFPNNVALYYEGIKVTYKELGTFIDKAANGFASLGVKKGDTVAIMLPNCPQFVISYFAALKCGAIVAPINPLSVAKELRTYLQDTKAKTIVVLNFFYRLVEEVRKESDLENVIVTAGWDPLGSAKRALAPKTVYKNEMKDVPPLRKGDRNWLDFLAGAQARSPEGHHRSGEGPRCLSVHRRNHRNSQGRNANTQQLEGELRSVWRLDGLDCHQR